MSLDTADQDLMWPMDVEYSLVDNSSTKAIIQVGPGITTMSGQMVVVKPEHCVQ